MYPVSGTFRNLAIQDAPKTRCRIYFIGDNVDCTDDNDVQTNGTLLVGKAGDTDSNGRIGQNGVKYTQFYNKNKNITIGDSLSSQIEMVLLNYDGALNGFAFGRCKVYIDVWDAANSVWENCPIGVFYIEQPAKTRLSLVTVRGFDSMQKFNAIADTWWSAINWSAGLTCSDLLDLMASNLGLQHATDDTSVLSNTSVTFTSAPFPCVENTYKDILKYIGEFTTANSIIDRNGRLALKAFKAIYESGNGQETYTGSSVNFTGSVLSDIDSLAVDFAPIQDLHGYSSPWPGGGGKNKFKTTLETQTKNQVTVTVDEDGFIHLTGTANATTIFRVGSYTFAPGEYYITMCPPGGSTSTYRVYASFGSNDTGNGWTKTFTQETEIMFQININSGTNVDGLVFKPMICLSSEGTEFAPYANICPISGRTGLSVYVSPTQDVADATTYASDWTSTAGTVYGGTLDVVTGLLTVDRANIASYNGEAIIEPWLSSMDAYAAGSTPTTGAQVVYTLDTPLTYQLTAQEVSALVGPNNVWSDGGNVTVTVSGISPVTIDTDTVGNQCLSIDVAEYSVAKIDRLRGIFSDNGTGVTVGSGINEYTITSNALFSGPDATETQNRLTQTYNKLNAIRLYHPISGRFIYDWSIDSGDIILIQHDNTQYIMPIFQQVMMWRGGFVVADILSDGDATRPVLGSSERDYYRLDTETKTMTIEADRINLLGYTTINNGFKVNLDGTFEANGATVNGTVTSNATINGGTNTAEVSGGAFTFKRNNDTLMETSYSSGGMKTEYKKPDGTTIVEIEGYGGPNSGVTVYPPNGSGSSYIRQDEFGVNVNGVGTQFVVDSNGVSVNASPGNEITYNGSSIVLKSYVDSTSANYTIGSGHYVAVNYPPGINPTNCVSIGMYVFSSVSGPITLIPYGQTENDTKWYIIGDAGVTLTDVKFRYWYL